MSKKITATDGRSYSLEYDLPLVRDIRDAIGVDLLSNEGIHKAAGNVIDFAEVLWHSVKVQAERQGVDEADFVRSIQSNLDECADAWLGAIADFFDLIGRSALARLARALVETERSDRLEANKLMTAVAARKLTDLQTTANSANRRRAIDDLLGVKLASDPSTNGAPSRS